MSNFKENINLQENKMEGLVEVSNSELIKKLIKGGNSNDEDADNVSDLNESDIEGEDDGENDNNVDEDEDVETDTDDESIVDEDDLAEKSNKVAKKGGAKAGEGAIVLEEGEGEGEGEGDDEEEDDEDDNYLQKFNQAMREDLISNFHPESKSHNYEEIKQMAKVTRNKNGVIVDELHKTIPILTKYEKTRILGQRSKQIECGAVTMVQVPPNVIDSYLIAKLELEQNKIPFIIRRPLPNGGMEYWYVSDLENL